MQKEYGAIGSKRQSSLFSYRRAMLLFSNLYSYQKSGAKVQIITHIIVFCARKVKICKRKPHFCFIKQAKWRNFATI